MKKLSNWIPAFLWMGIIFYSSSTPYEAQNVQPLLQRWLDLAWLTPYISEISFTYNGQIVSAATHGTEGFVEFFIRKGAHVVVFFTLALLFYWAIVRTWNFSVQISLLSAWLLTVVYAITDELHQRLTPNRTPYFGDVVLDSTGAIAAVLFIFFLRRR
ncbi:VanZ family protein [Halobacillus sp. Marseille-Q1614]|uniref:VanZ family protein n=1 Tax=Halobacillus sp. Marseille-Q1614 TaxID=2709134 RepID=UPI001570EBBC|nr:VanZ family protein [Halobacillus sp. Marseille-Q1614]